MVNLNVSLLDDVALRAAQAAADRGVTVEELTSAVLQAYFEPDQASNGAELSFIGLGDAEKGILGAQRRGAPRSRGIHAVALVVDTGPLVAAAVRNDPDHAACAELLKRETGSLVVPALVLDEASYLVRKALGMGAEATLLRAAARGEFTA
jgi:hypothetical protein